MAQGKKTGGRRAGTPNKANGPIADVLMKLGTDKAGVDLHAARLHQLTLSDDEHVSIKALHVVMAYRHGKPTEHHQITGEGGGPVTVRFVDAGA